MSLLPAVNFVYGSRLFLDPHIFLANVNLFLSVD